MNELKVGDEIEGPPPGVSIRVVGVDAATGLYTIEWQEGGRTIQCSGVPASALELGKPN